MKTMLNILISAALALICLTTAAAQGKKDEEKKPAGQGVEGYWMGPLKVGAIELRLVFKVVTKDGALSATLDSPDQGAKGIPVDEADFKDGTLRLEIKSIAGTFEGKLSKDGGELAGEWKQGDMALPLTLKRHDKEPAFARPQEPKRPFPYIEEEVSYENKGAKVKFGGTLTLPKGDGPFPAVLLITGSGPQDRDESLMGHKPFLVIADHLTRKGVAVLRVDDRGVGKSTGSTNDATTDDFAGDALAGVAFLKGRKEIDPKRIGLLGHSEGGLVAPLAASRSGDVAFVVMLAGTGLPGEDILYLQGRRILEAGKTDEKGLASQRKIQETIFNLIKEEKDEEKVLGRFKEIWDKELAKLTDKERKEMSEAEGALKQQLKMATTPWFRYFLTYDPLPALRKTKCPVLALWGENDLQVPPKENMPAVEKALKEGGNKDFTLREFPGLNHLFQACKTGLPSEYGAIEETMSPQSLETVSAWILKRFGKV